MFEVDESFIICSAGFLIKDLQASRYGRDFRLQHKSSISVQNLLRGVLKDSAKKKVPCMT